MACQLLKSAESKVAFIKFRKIITLKKQGVVF